MKIICAKDLKNVVMYWPFLLLLSSHIVSSADRFAANGQLSPNIVLKDQLFIILSNAFDLCLNFLTGISKTVRFFLFMNLIFLSLLVALPI
jgi:hypothetical protein